MIIKTPRNDNGYYDLKITDSNNKSFFMTVGGNLDLFWIPENHKENRTFEIHKDDKLTYTMFNKLFKAIEKVDDKYNPSLNNNVFNFISEDWHEDEANRLSITRNEEQFTINFIENTNRENWSFPHRGCNICFCNSGSRVPKVEYLFMRMFNYLAYECDLINIDNPHENEII